MKKSVLVLGLVALFITSCGDTKKEEVKKEAEAPVEVAKETTTKSPADYVALGEKLFTEKTCATCHQADMKVIGPSIKDMNKVYAEKNANMVKFLKGESEAIVDTDPGQVAIMKANIDGFLKEMSSEEIAALVAYMSSVK